MTSSVSDSCRVWDTTIDPTWIASDGDIEHMRKALDRTSKSRSLQAGEMVFMSDLTPHEVLPQASSSERTYFRLIVGKVSVWEAKTCTANPLGTQPDAKITHENKFAEPVDTDFFGLVHEHPRSKWCFISVPGGAFFDAIVIPETMRGDLSTTCAKVSNKAGIACANQACGCHWPDGADICPQCGHADQQWFATWKEKMAEYKAHSSSQTGLFVHDGNLAALGHRQRAQWKFLHDAQNEFVDKFAIVDLSQTESMLEQFWLATANRGYYAVLSYCSDLVPIAQNMKAVLSSKYLWPHTAMYIDGDCLATLSDTTVEIVKDSAGNPVLGVDGKPRSRVLNDKWSTYYREAMCESGNAVFLISKHWCDSPWCNLELLWFLLLRAGGRDALMAAPQPDRLPGHKMEGSVLPKLRAEVERLVTAMAEKDRADLMATAFFCTQDAYSRDYVLGLLADLQLPPMEIHGASQLEDMLCGLATRVACPSVKPISTQGTSYHLQAIQEWKAWRQATKVRSSFACTRWMHWA